MQIQNLLTDQLNLVIQHYRHIADFDTYLPAIATKLELLPYIHARLERGTFPLENHVGEPLLNITIIQHQRLRGFEGDLKTFLEIWTRKNGYTLPNAAVIKLLLEHGADPNQQYESSTPWLNLVQLAKTHDQCPLLRPEKCSDWLDIIELFLQHGAEPKVRKDVATGGRLRDAFRRYEPVRVAKLDALVKSSLKEKQKAQSHRLLQMPDGTRLRQRGIRQLMSFDHLS